MDLALILRLLLALALALAVGLLGRLVAKATRQPPVIGEVAGGVLLGPLIVLIAGRDGLAAVFPADVLLYLKYLGEIGLVLFLVHVAHELRCSLNRAQFGSIGWVAVGSFVPALLAGVLFGLFVLATGDAGLRGTAPLPAFLVFVAVSLSVTAVPVLARILVDRGLVGSLPGSLSMAAAVAVDAVNWPILAVAVGLATGSGGGVVRALTVLAVGILLSLLLQRALRTAVMLRFSGRYPRSTMALFALIALAAARGTESAGLTAIFGAFLIGLAVPAGARDGSWPRAMASLSWAGTRLVPIFFVVTGVNTFAKPFTLASWIAVPVVIGLAMIGKIGGGYLGARLAGHPAPVAWRVGILMDTRGLTELIALQAGLGAGILSAELYFVCVLMALVTTGLTGPLLSLIERRDRNRAASVGAA